MRDDMRFTWSLDNFQIHFSLENMRYEIKIVVVTKFFKIFAMPMIIRHECVLLQHKRLKVKNLYLYSSRLMLNSRFHVVVEWPPKFAVLPSSNTFSSVGVVCSMLCFYYAFSLTCHWGQQTTRICGARHCQCRYACVSVCAACLWNARDSRVCERCCTPHEIVEKKFCRMRWKALM